MSHSGLALMYSCSASPSSLLLTISSCEGVCLLLDWLIGSEAEKTCSISQILDLDRALGEILINK